MFYKRLSVLSEYEVCLQQHVQNQYHCQVRQHLYHDFLFVKKYPVQIRQQQMLFYLSFHKHQQYVEK